MRLLSVLMISLVLAACGFQLRGEVRLPEVMNTTWLRTPDDSSAFVRELGLILRANGVSVSTTQQPGAAQLHILSERMRRDALTISGSARVREFVLGFEVDFELLDADGELLIERETLRMSRDYSFDEQEILAATREEEFLRDEMRRAMAARLLRRIEAL